ncbi:MAG: alpha/beta fold hydrolase [Candidatus Eremiobacteraeota bacterium]|nr:alpha/beta fold hydrolase [Candidatus Eremiobacteraeota bacterium]
MRHARVVVHACSVLVLIALARPAAIPAQAAESPVTVSTTTGTLQGTLTLPDGATTQRVPVALIVAGSGPTNRDGSNPLGVTVTPYRLLANALALRGIATLRYDKRGIAASTTSAPIPSGVTFQAYVDDVAAWARQLRADRRFSRIVVVGHSEGSLLAMLAAARAPVDGVVSLEGAGRPAVDIIVEQLKGAGAPETLLERTRQIGEAIRDGNDPGAVPDQLAPLYPAYLRRYEREWFSIDPAQAAKAVPAPLLVIQGGADIQVNAADAHRLADAHPGAVLRIIPKMTHVLLDAGGTDRASNIATYTDTSLPLDAALVDTIVAFILQTPLPPAS